MKKSISTCLLILYSLSTSAQEVQVKIDQLIQGYVQSKDFNGTALIVKNNEVILKKGYGLRNLETLTKNDENGIYQVGSLTKQFTAALVMQLEQEGKLSIYEMIIKYFPDFPNGDKIKIQHLLNHTSGLYDFSDDPEIVKKDVTIPYQKKELLATFMKYPLKFDPGTKYKYSNIGYILLGYIIEKVSGKSFEQNVRERIFQPLGMTYSGFDFAGLQHQHKEKGYTSVKAVTPIASFIVDSTVSYASGSIFSTVDDLYKWERAIYTEKILSQSTWKAIFTPYKNKYGYGWGIDSLFNKEVMVHGGNIPGFSSYILRLPEDKSLIILLDNTSSAALPKLLLLYYMISPMKHLVRQKQMKLLTSESLLANIWHPLV
jgi:CubicO group peptidase (beta-lactamase class C family)